MNIEFTEHAWEDFMYWTDMDPEIVEKIIELLRDIQKWPFKGLGIPEPLRHDLKGYWSRRISGEHRLVYKIEGQKSVNQKCVVIQCRFHY